MIDPFATVALPSLVRANARLGYNVYPVVTVTRQDRFQARQQRRWGDWTYWGISAPVLWLEDPFVLSPFNDTLFVTPDYVDIWGD